MKRINSQDANRLHGLTPAAGHPLYCLWEQESRADPHKSKKDDGVGRNLQIEIRKAVNQDSETAASTGEKDTLGFYDFCRHQEPNMADKQTDNDDPERNGYSDAPFGRCFKVIIVRMLEQNAQ